MCYAQKKRVKNRRCSSSSINEVLVHARHKSYWIRLMVATLPKGTQNLVHTLLMKLFMLVQPIQRLRDFNRESI